VQLESASAGLLARVWDRAAGWFRRLTNIDDGSDLATCEHGIGHHGGGQRRRPARFVRWIAHWMHGKGPREAFAYGASGVGVAKRLESRYAHAFAECPASATNTSTSDGLAACTPNALSNCTSDPSNAIVPLVPETGNFTVDGKGKINFSIKPTGFAFGGQVHGFETCSGEPYNGAVNVQALARVTFSGDPACGADRCTAVDTLLFNYPLNVVNGSIGLTGRFPLSAIGPLRSSDTMSAEILQVALLDTSGNSVVVGPAMVVRCNQATESSNLPGGSAFCFGN